MLTMLFDTSWFYDLLLIVAILAVVYFLIKFPQGRIYVGIFLTLALTGFSIFSLIEVNTYYSVKGGIIGVVNGILSKNTGDIESSLLVVKDLQLIQEKDKEYSVTIVFNGVLKVEDNLTYDVLVNGEICDSYTISSDYISAEYLYCFMDENFNEIQFDTLYFYLNINKTNTKLKVTTKGGSKLAKLWNEYYSRNGLTFELKIKEG